MHQNIGKGVLAVMKTARQLTDLIGNTPLLELNRYAAGKGLEDACLLGKLYSSILFPLQRTEWLSL